MGAQQTTNRSVIEGFQVASLSPNSPAHEGGLIPFFDFIVGADGVELDRENSSDFRGYIKKHKGKETKLFVHNTKTRSLREVTVTPSDTWGGAGLLGCSINWESVDQAQEYIWHITDVHPNTPAAEAGIQAGRDYLIGMQTIMPNPDPSVPPHISMFSEKSDFHNRMAYLAALRGDPPRTNAPHLNQLLLLMYDAIDNSVRELMVDLDSSVCLGCDVANGYLHVIPVTQGDTRLPVIQQFYVADDGTGEEAAVSKPTLNEPIPLYLSVSGISQTPTTPGNGHLSANNLHPRVNPALSHNLAPHAAPAPLSPFTALPTAEGSPSFAHFGRSPATPSLPLRAAGSTCSLGGSSLSPVELGQQPTYAEPSWANALNSTLT
ncbi:Golgi reassembly stacking protein [Diplonema papillatum]|nr:Golgi reassembly stacking protein [Diplonema papillatum]